MAEPYYLPLDYARCWGALADDDDLGPTHREDCRTCLRRLAAAHQLPVGERWTSPQPQPCEQHLPANPSHIHTP